MSNGLYVKTYKPLQWYFVGPLLMTNKDDDDDD